MGNGNGQAFWGCRHHLPEPYQRQRIMRRWIETGLRLQAMDKQQSVLRQWLVMWPLLMLDKINQSLDRDRAVTASNGRTAVCLETGLTRALVMHHKINQSLDRDRAATASNGQSSLSWDSEEDMAIFIVSQDEPVIGQRQGDTQCQWTNNSHRYDGWWVWASDCRQLELCL